MKPRTKYAAIGLAALVVVGAGAWAFIDRSLEGAFARGPTEGPATADGECPVFRDRYPSCEIRFGNSGLSTLNSFYETFVGEGAFEIDSFTVDTRGEGRFAIAAQSNRGPITSDIVADQLVRLGNERENEEVFRTHEASFCDAGRIYEHVVTYRGDALTVQDLEFWTKGDELWFRLFQNGSPTAEVVCR